MSELKAFADDKREKERDTYPAPMPQSLTHAFRDEPQFSP